jgi:hypothetical protein
MVEWSYWFPRIDPESPESSKVSLRRLIHYYTTINYYRVVKELFEPYEGHGILPSLKKRLRRASKPIKLLKDPMALFCIPWMVQEFGVRPVILLRHPAAFALSIKDKGWWFDFEHMLDQPGFFAGELEPFKEEVVRYQQKDSPTIIENAALFWKIGYARVMEYQEQFPGWYYVKHEDLSLSPMDEFSRLFDYLELDFNRSVKDFIASSTKAGIGEESKHRRDSKANVTKWRTQLAPSEQALIYEVTASVSDHFYEPF